MTTSKKPDALHVHEILHGARLAADLLERVFAYESAHLVEGAFPEVQAAHEKAAAALEELYQAVGRIELN